VKVVTPMPFVQERYPSKYVADDQEYGGVLLLR